MKKCINFFYSYTRLFVVFLILGSCSSSGTVDKEANPHLESLDGDGNVNRTQLTHEFLQSGDQDTIVDFRNYSVPSNAAFPSNTFEGKLTLHNLDKAGQSRRINSRSTDSIDTVNRMHLPPFDYEYVQSGSHIIPLRRGYLENEHPHWEYILEPGRVWDEKDDNGFSRVALPFTLKQKNANCVHNGVFMFLFKNNGSTSHLAYQIVSETCAYSKFDMWGIVEVTYTPTTTIAKENYIQDYVAEVTGRMPTKPISELSADYPGAQPREFSSPKEVTQEHMTLYGFVIDGINYVGGCETRFGTYPFCEVLNVPSYSTAKSISAGLGLMRMEKLYPGSRKTFIGDLLPDCNQNGIWADVTMENALDMATGNYETLKPLVDEGLRHTRRFFFAEDHKDKLDYSCNIYKRQAKPGTKWVYHTFDTYIVGTAMNVHLRAKTGDKDADYFRDLIVKDIFEPLNLSPTSKVQQRTYDSIAQPFSGYGLFYHHDDVAKIGQFLNNGAKINNKAMLDENMFSSIMKENLQSGLEVNAPGSRYDNGFWLRKFDDPEICSEMDLIPALEGYGGIKIFLLPNNTVYYYFSDNHEYVGKEGVLESNRIRPFCP